VIGSKERQPNRRSKSGLPPAATELSKLEVIVPGSTANLGPGFDALAMAVNLYCKLTFDILETNDLSVPLITLKGALTKGLPKDQSNLIYTVLSNLWRGDPNVLKRVRITIESEIPLGKGVGSSAAAIVGAVWAAYALTENIPDNGTLLRKAGELEGHADNVSASLLGGLVVCAKAERSKSIVTQKVHWPKEWCPIITVPRYVLSTKKSRAVLPRTLQREDAVFNIQRASLLIAAVQNKDEEALREALHDRLHEPYREQLVPELPAVRKVVSGFPVLGTVLSGAGSSVLTLVNRRHRKEVCERIQTWAATLPEPPDVYALEVDQEGLRVNYE